MRSYCPTTSQILVSPGIGFSLSSTRAIMKSEDRTCISEASTAEHIWMANELFSAINKEGYASLSGVIATVYL